MRELTLVNRRQIFPPHRAGKSGIIMLGGRCGRYFMRRLATTTWLASIAAALLQISAASASDLVWEVQNPFRFFKKPAAFALHEKAYDAVRGKADSALPGNIVWRTERRLNDPDCSDKSSRSEEHTSELQSPCNLVCRLLLEKKKK